MEGRLELRASDSPFVHAVSLWTIGDEPNLACPDGLWDLVVYRGALGEFLLLTGQTTRAVPLAFRPGDEVLTIAFKASTFLPGLPAADRLDGAQPLTRRGRRFEWAFDTLEIPRFDNAEGLVSSLERRGLIDSDDLVEANLAGRPKASSLRSLQRHFQRTTGLAPRDFHALDRAGRAAEALRAGVPPSRVAFDAGYADQAHLSRSMKTLLGKTPTQLRAEGRPKVGVWIQDPA